MKKFIYLSLFLILLFALGACSKVYEVTYLDDDGSVIASYSVNQGEDAPVPESPFKEGFTFDGWSQEALNVSEDLQIQAQYSEIEEVLFVPSEILVLTFLEGLEDALEAFLEDDVKVVASLEGLELSNYLQVIVLYDDALRAALHPARIGAPLIRKDELLTFEHAEEVAMTLLYLEDTGAFKEFFKTFDITIFDLEGIQDVYALFPLKGIAVYDASSMWEAQLLVDRFENAQLFKPSDDLRWFKTHAEIYLFLGRQIPSFLAEYRAQIETLENQAIKIINERGQQIVIGRSTSTYANEYFDSFLQTVEDGFEGTVNLSGYRPERFLFPQDRPVAADFCYTEELRGPRYPSMLPYDVTLSHDIPRGRIPSKGTVTGLNVMISFDEYPSIIPDEDFKNYIVEAMRVSDDFFNEMSNGQLTFEWRYTPEVIYVPFFLDPTMTPDNPNYESRINDHVALVTSIVEETIDLTDVEIINYYWAPGLPEYVYGGLSALLYEPMETERGTIYNYNVKKFEMRYIDDPVVFARNTYHGIGHNLGLSDIYVQQWIPEFVGKPPNYKYGNWDVMTSAINELNAWHRWILAWIEDEQVHCLPPEEGVFEVFIEPLNETDGDTRMITIPLSESEVIYIELRGEGPYCPVDRWRSFSYPWLQGGCTQNVLVTHLNTMIGNGHGPKQILRPARSTEEDYSDALLLEGEYVTFKNITITHSERYHTGSVIKIKIGQ